MMTETSNRHVVSITVEIECDSFIRPDTVDAVVYRALSGAPELAVRDYEVVRTTEHVETRPAD